MTALAEAILERDYCLAWFLVGLSRSILREALVFKGGTALRRCYFGDYGEASRVGLRVKS